MPLIGFTKSHFQKSSARTLARCISRPFCGSDEESYSNARAIIKNYLINTDIKTKGLFISLMTIDTHAPYISKDGPLLGFKNQLDVATERLFVFFDWLYNLDLSSRNTYIVLTTDHPPGGLPISKNTSSTANNNHNSNNKAKTNFVYMLQNTR